VKDLNKSSFDLPLFAKGWLVTLDASGTMQSRLAELQLLAIIKMRTFH